MLSFTGERIVPQADNCEPQFALKMYQEHVARYLFASQICAGKRVLDIGCGVGYGSHLLARSGAERVTAFDISPEAIEHARKFYVHPNLTFEVGSAESFHYQEQFDVITCFELIEHVDGQADVLACAAGALHSNGHLIISTPRRLNNKRSAFHTKELSPFEFLHLIESRFQHVAHFFENNHFASLVDRGEPREITRIHCIHRQFSFEQSDYMIVVASPSPVDATRFQGQLVLNNDAYLTTLDRDVNILHRSEDDLHKQVELLSQANEDFKIHLSGALSQLADKTAAEAAVSEKLRAAEESAGRDRQALLQLDENTSQLRTQIAALEHVRSEQANASEELQRRLEAARTEIAEKQLAGVELQERLRVTEANAQDDRELHGQLEREVSELRTQVSVLEQVRADQAKTNSDLQKQLNANEDLQRRLEAAKAGLAEKQLNAVELQERLRLAEANAHNDRERCRQLERDVSELRTQVSVLEQVRAEQTNANSELQRHLAAALSEMAERQLAEAELQEKLRLAGVSAHFDRDRHNQLSAELSAKQATIDGLEEAVEEGNLEVSRLRSQLQAAQRKITSLDAQAASSEQERAAIDTQFTAAQRQIGELTAAVEAAQQSMQKQELRLQNLKAALGRANWTAADRDRIHSEELVLARSASVELETNCREFIASARAAMEQMRTALADKEREVSYYHDQLRTVLKSRSWQMTSAFRSIAGDGITEHTVKAIAPPVWERISIAPPESFDERSYLDANPDVAGAVRTGAFASGFEHWVLYGSEEVRQGRRSGHRPYVPARRDSIQRRRGGLPYRASFDVLYIIGCHDGESKRYRVFNLIEFLTAAGHKAAAFTEEDIPNLIESEVHFQTLVIFRSAYHAGIGRIIEYGRSRGSLIVFDVDDLIFEPENIHYVRVLSTFSPQQVDHYRSDIVRYRKVLSEADIVTCTTEFLAQRAQAAGAESRVIPNSINAHQMAAAERLLVERRRDRAHVRIGYFSGSNTHQVDFRSCEGALLKIMEERPECRFVLVGILDLDAGWDRFADRVERHPMLSYTEMLSVLASIDINLAPLEIGNPYCESKSQLKIFEAGLVEVPTIASAVSSYKESIRQGVDGFLASREADWLEAFRTLLSSDAVRTQVGQSARERALMQFGPASVTRAVTAVYQLDNPLPGKPAQTTSTPSKSAVSAKLKISWIVPGLIIGGGGHRNILRAAYHLEQFGHELELYFTSTDLDSHQLKQIVNEHFYPLQCRMSRYDGNIAPTDVLFATHWSTVDAALKARHLVGEIMYFVQDFEPMFAPMGTEYVLAENTYRQGLYCITSGPWCERLLRRDYAAEADHFALPVDSDIYYPQERTKLGTNILFFAKPEMPRRCYELGIMALTHVHQRRPDVEIQLFGSGHLKERQFPFPASVMSIVPTIQDLARMYSNADLGIVFSTTNPSLVPYEMMSCGLPVVDLGREGNEINYGGRFNVALLTDPAPEVMAHQICELLSDKKEAALRSRNGLQFVKAFPSELQMARRVEELILRRVASKRN